MPRIIRICVFPETLFIRGLTEMMMILTHNSRDKPLHILIDQCFWQSPGDKHRLLCSDKVIVCLDKLKYTQKHKHPPWSLRALGHATKISLVLPAASCQTQRSESIDHRYRFMHFFPASLFHFLNTLLLCVTLFEILALWYRNFSFFTSIYRLANIVFQHDQLGLSFGSW